MYRKVAPIIVLCAAFQVLGVLPPAPASEKRDYFIQALQATELQNGSTDKLSDRALSEVTLLSKTVEAKRNIYARALELYIERIGAGKDVDQALIDYERAEISLAAEWQSTRKVLAVIKKQDHLAHEWKHHRTLHPDRQSRPGHPSDHSNARNADHHSYDNSADADKPRANSGASFLVF
ncbi:hypothetical protein BH10CYA1_BH10CYA1_60150 [soil metagenome]